MRMRQDGLGAPLINWRGVGTTRGLSMLTCTRFQLKEAVPLHAACRANAHRLHSLPTFLRLVRSNDNTQ